MNVRVISVTPEAERIIAYCARVSNPANQENDNISGLLAYCMKHGHWSIFEMANMCVEIVTTRAISAQILRHRSFSFQEFSQRYAQSTDFIMSEVRRQDTSNRQNSIDDLPRETQEWWEDTQNTLGTMAMLAYEEALEKGIAKECARMLLPMSTETKIYMNGSLRSWLHYIQLRANNDTQLEHRQIAIGIKELFIKQFPIIGGLL